MKNTEQKPPSDFEVMADFNRLYSAYLEARNGKRWKYAVVRFEVNLLENLMALHFLLTSRKYRPSPYNYFLVHEPKERLIMYNGFRDKIIQHSLCDNVLEPRLAKTFILDNYASQKGKGTHFGLDRLKAFMQRYYRQFGADGWVLKCDIRKYFYSINHDVLKSQLRRIIDDPGVLWLLDLIIDSTEGPGIPIGNHTSQWFAVLYLSGLDHMIKERLGIKFYGRFLGFRTYMTDSGKVVRKIRRDSKNRIRRKLKKFRHLLDEGRIDFETVVQSYSSWTGHAEHGNSYHLIRQTNELFYDLFKKEMEEYHVEKIVDVARRRGGEIGQHEV